MQNIIYIYSALTWNYKIYNYDNCGAKGIGDSGPFHIKLIAHAKEEEMSEDKQRKSRPLGVMSRTTLSSVDQDHERGRCHATKESLLERPNGNPKCHGPTIGAWRRSDPRKGRYLHIKYPQLTSWPH